jgi:3-phenylpropionate/trans-cinnamate dioxygenase ferredoxin reductase subunit
LNNKIVIAGAGHAGGRCALLLRQKGFDGPISLIGEEPDLPYERPPLSKGLLTGNTEFESCLLAAREYYLDQKIDIFLNDPVVSIDREAGRVRLRSGSDYSYNKLVIATGGHCRKLHCPGSQLENICELRSVRHSRLIAERLIPGANVVIVGGGFIGLEVAASAVRNNCVVTVVETADRLLGRVFPEPVSSELVEMHAKNSVAVILNDNVERFSGGLNVETVYLASGKQVPADIVIVGIGIVPRTELVEDTGLQVDNGVRANQFCQTSDPEIYAIGDCARSYNQRYQQWMRLESWKNAEQQADIVASHICGVPDPWSSVPWFWSDQYQYNIQMAGFFRDAGGREVDEVVRRGEISQGKVMYFGLQAGMISGAVAIGEGASAARDLRVSQMLIDQCTRVSTDELVDPTVKLRSLLQAS